MSILPTDRVSSAPPVGNESIQATLQLPSHSTTAEENISLRGRIRELEQENEQLKKNKELLESFLKEISSQVRALQRKPDDNFSAVVEETKGLSLQIEGFRAKIAGGETMKAPPSAFGSFVKARTVKVVLKQGPQS